MTTQFTTAASTERSLNQVLVEPAWLHEHLNDPRVRLVEVDVSPATYEAWHIEGAVLWDIYRDLKDADYRLVDREAVQRLLERSGIAPDSIVVFYGYAPAIGFWLTKLYGHTDARILDCDRESWREEGRPWTVDLPAPTTSEYVLCDEDAQIRADRVEVESAIDDRARSIIDVRTTPEFRGERFWPSGGLEDGGRAGHIPSAVHHPFDDLYDEKGSFRPVDDLREQLSSLEALGTNELIVYCTIGARACTAWWVLTYLLGRESVRVYDGSWAEWGRLPMVPVARP